MCYFGKTPAWKFPDEDITDKVTEETTYIFNECEGTAEQKYLIFIVVVHVYFLVEYLMRLIIQKYPLKFLISVESFLEIFTTVPLLATLISLGPNAYAFQFFSTMV